MEQAMTAKTTRITVETETLLVIRGAKAFLAWCPSCGAEVNVIALDNESLAGSITAAQIQEWLGTSGLHFWETANGPARICLTSLFQCFELEQVKRFSHSHEGLLDQSRRKQK